MLRKIKQLVLVGVKENLFKLPNFKRSSVSLLCKVHLNTFISIHMCRLFVIGAQRPHPAPSALITPKWHLTMESEENKESAI